MNESLIWLGKGGQSSFLSEDAGEEPLGEVPNPLRGCSHNTTKEGLTPFRAAGHNTLKEVPSLKGV